MDAKEQKSFCHKLIQELDSPEDGDDELYWHQDVVPLINKCIIDKRSNAYMGVKEALDLLSMMHLLINGTMS